MKVSVSDNLDKLVDTPIAVNFLDIGLVLLDQLIQCQCIDPNGIINITAIK